MTAMSQDFDYLLEPNQNPDNISGIFIGTDEKHILDHIVCRYTI